MGASILDALLKRGLSDVQANALIDGKYNIQKIQTLNEAELDALQLGLSADQKKALLSGRSPIPDDVFNELMFKSRYVCCVCRDRTKGIIVHHIQEWATGGRHELDNLVVLCLHHHGEAHTKRELSQELTADKIRGIRDKWYKFVNE